MMTTTHYKRMKHISSLTFLLASWASLAAEEPPLSLMAQGGTGYRINDLRSFEVDENTLYFEDGSVITETRAQGGTGYKIRYRIVDPANNLRSGTLTELDLINVYKGPVVSLSPLKIFAVDNLITGNTVWIDDLDPGQLQLGDELKISGFVDTASLVLITRAEISEDLTEWKLSGYVEQLNGTNFQLDQQWVAFQPQDVSGCSGPLAEGRFVEVKASPVNNFKLGDPLNTVLSIECIDQQVLPDEDDAQVIIEGFIDEVEPDEDFFLAGQFIGVDSGTRYIRGKAEDIQERIKVVVEGTADDVTGDVLADKVRFLEPRINLTVPVLPENQLGDQFFVAGVVLNVTPQTQDPDGVLPVLQEPRRLRFKGYDYGAGELFITRIDERGQVDYDDVGLNGEVNLINQPLIEVFGVSIDTTNSQFFDQNGVSVNAAAFFAQLVIGTEVELDVATLDPNTGLISGGELTIQEFPEPDHSQPGDPDAQGGTGVRGVGTISGTPDVIFIGSFD
jgi:hypothetical protein